MKRRNAAARAAALLLAVVGITTGNLLINGDFEEPLNVGWEENVRSAAGSHRFERSDTLGQPVPGHAAKVFKQLAYHAALRQQVEVTDVNLTLTFDARMSLAGGSSTCWPTGVFVVNYLDADGAELGATMFLLRDQYNDWRESDTLKLYEVEEPGVWTRYELDIARELADNLPGVNSSAVRRLQVQLFSYVNGT